VRYALGQSAAFVRRLGAAAGIFSRSFSAAAACCCSRQTATVSVGRVAARTAHQQNISNIHHQDITGCMLTTPTAVT